MIKTLSTLSTIFFLHCLNESVNPKNLVMKMLWDLYFEIGTTPPYLSPTLPFECFQLLYKDMGAIRHCIGNPNIGVQVVSFES